MELWPGTGVNITTTELASIKTMSQQPTILARNLFRRIFTTEELSSHSLFGKTSNANHAAVILPSIDATRRDAVISKS